MSKFFGIIDAMGAVDGMPAGEDMLHPDYFPGHHKNWRYGAGVVWVTWEADIQEQESIRQWLAKRGEVVREFKDWY